MINYCLKEIEASIKQYETVIRNLRQSNDELQSKIDWYKEEDKANNENLEEAYNEIKNLEETIQKLKKDKQNTFDDKINQSLLQQLKETGTQRKQLEKENKKHLNTIIQLKKQLKQYTNEKDEQEPYLENAITSTYNENQILKQMLLDNKKEYYSKGILVKGHIYTKNDIIQLTTTLKETTEDREYYKKDCIHRLTQTPHIYRTKINQLEEKIQEQDQLIEQLQDDANIQMIKDYERHHHY